MSRVSEFSLEFVRPEKMKTAVKIKQDKGQKGISLPEIMIVLIILAILVVLALPQIIASRQMFRFSAVQRQVAATLNEARQNAMSQRKPVTFRYVDAGKQVILYGGDFGALNDAKNQVTELSGSGLAVADIAYGRPGGAPTTALADTSNMTVLAKGAVEITFQPDGSVVDAANNPQDNALFFYNKKYPKDAAFAVSVLGAGGRIKVWRYNKTNQKYVE